eukprot:COSAG02_NODE_561_length_20308_cov_42.799495_1_plen_55_part_00
MENATAADEIATQHAKVVDDLIKDCRELQDREHGTARVVDVLPVGCDREMVGLY